MRIVDVGLDLGLALLEVASGVELGPLLAGDLSAELNICMGRVSLVTVPS